MILLDTHVAIWVATDSKLIGPRCRRAIERNLANGAVFVSAISFWEIALLIAKRRFKSGSTADQLRNRLLAAGVNEAPLSGEIAILAVGLDSLHGDPADRFIAATAIVHDATLMTADAELLRWRHPIARQDASK